MADTLNIFGTEYTGVTGIKATDDNGVEQTFYNLTNGDNLEYGQSSYPFMVIGSGQIGTGRVV